MFLVKNLGIGASAFIDLGPTGNTTNKAFGYAVDLDLPVIDFAGVSVILYSDLATLGYTTGKKTNYQKGFGVFGGVKGKIIIIDYRSEYRYLNKGFIPNYVDKFLIEKKIKDPIAITALASIAAGFIGIFIGIITGFNNIGFSQTAILIFAGILLTFYLIPYFEAIKNDDVSTVIPLFQFIPVFTLIMSAVILKETLTARQIVGLLLVVFAGIFVSAEKIEAKIFKPRKEIWHLKFGKFLISYMAFGTLANPVAIPPQSNKAVKPATFVLFGTASIF